MAQGVKFRGLLHFRLAAAGLASSPGRVSGGEGVNRNETHSHLELMVRQSVPCRPFNSPLY
jgi:hypothetical protein